MGDGGGAAPTAETPAAVVPEPAAATPPREPTMLEKVQAAVRDKGVILAENNNFRTEIAALKDSVAEREAGLATLQARVGTLEAENRLLQADFQSIDAALKSSEAKAVSIDTAAARQIAGMGFEASVLPTPDSGPQETFASLKAKIESEPDDRKRWKLAEQLEALVANT